MSNNEGKRKDIGLATAYAYAVAHGYVGTEEEFGEYLANAGIKAEQTVRKAEEAATSASNSHADALVAEGFTKGTQNGAAVPATSPYYENNAKYYLLLTRAAAGEAEALLIKEKLVDEMVPDTTQAIAFDQTTGNVQSITHSSNGVAVRTDVYTFGTNTITEVRTLSTGQSLTIVTNTETLATTITYDDGQAA